MVDGERKDANTYYEMAMLLGEMRVEIMREVFGEKSKLEEIRGELND